ncbi:MAG: DUF255 domain-containing protein [Pseudomonadota bacterium]
MRRLPPLLVALILAGGPAMAADPPAVTRPVALGAQLEAAYTAMGPDYIPRTQLLEQGRAKYVNRLILEASPYLLQHAHNPVDWQGWGPEALAEARATGKPIFLSIGYATCHWCHVMEEESFDNEEVAALLNANFIPIKIDREERPDLDSVYITATQLQQGHAGWPNSLFLRPDGKPFHTGTYFPRPEFIQLLTAVAEAWATPAARGEIDQVAEQLSAAIKRLQTARMVSAPPPGPQDFSAAVARLQDLHNELQGGFSGAQQFPQEGYLLFLLDQWRRTGDGPALQMAIRTLDAIAAGGIHDHVGGGFHRYAVDPNWRTPHFEKMLYNQGQLARAFIEGWEATGEPAYARAAHRVFAYIRRDMTDAQGAFYAAEDADSRDPRGVLEEGAFYLLPPEDARAALGQDGAFAVEALGLDQPATLDGGPVAHLDPLRTTDFAKLDPMLEALRKYRDARPRPLRDDKVIAGWNGLMIRALAAGAVAFDRPDYAERAARAGDALWSRLWTGERLARLWVGGAAVGDGTLADYAWLGLGYLALDQASGDPKWRRRAVKLAQAMTTRFADGTGRLKMAALDGPLGPIYDTSDGATPAGESSALEFLARLGESARKAELSIRAEELRAAIAAQMTEIPLYRVEGMIASRVLDAGVSTLRRTVAQGTLRLHLPVEGDRLHLQIAEGWHLNAAEPGPDWLIGARVEGAEAAWPEGKALALDFAETDVRVYEGDLAIPLTGAEGTVTFHLQACSDQFCLEPVEATFRLP